MDAKQKTQLNNWQRQQVYQMRDGGKMVLDDLIRKARNRFNNPTDLVIPELMDKCHPLLFMNYVLDWTKLTQSHLPVSYRDGKSFGEALIKEWQNICARHSFYKTGLLETYTNIEQVRGNINKLLSKQEGKLYHADGYEYMEEQLHLMREDDIKNEEAEAERQLQEEERRRQELEAEALRKKEQEEKRVKKQQKAVKDLSKANKEFHDKDGSPWTADNTTEPMAPPIPQTACEQVEADIRNLQHELTVHYGYPVSVSIGFKGAEYVLCYDARNGRKELDSADQVQYFGCEHLSECFSRARSALVTLQEAAKEAAEKQKQKEALQAQINAQMEQLKALQAQLNSL